jgi:hypothetical protein
MFIVLFLIEPNTLVVLAFALERRKAISGSTIDGRSQCCKQMVISNLLVNGECWITLPLYILNNLPCNNVLGLDASSQLPFNLFLYGSIIYKGF